jgi:hypothetical protein
MAVLNKTKRDRLLTLGLRIPKSKLEEINQLSSLLHVKPSEIARWIFDAGWVQKDKIIREKASALLAVLGETLPPKSKTDSENTLRES